MQRYNFLFSCANASSRKKRNSLFHFVLCPVPARCASRLASVGRAPRLLLTLLTDTPRSLLTLLTDALQSTSLLACLLLDFVLLGQLLGVLHRSGVVAVHLLLGQTRNPQS